MVSASYSTSKKYKKYVFNMIFHEILKNGEKMTQKVCLEIQNDFFKNKNIWTMIPKHQLNERDG